MATEIPEKPESRKEQYLAKAAGQDVVVPEPRSREEQYLNAIAEGGGGSGGTANFDELENRPKYNGEAMTGDTDIEGPRVVDYADYNPKGYNQIPEVLLAEYLKDTLKVKNGDVIRFTARNGADSQQFYLGNKSENSSVPSYLYAQGEYVDIKVESMYDYGNGAGFIFLSLFNAEAQSFASATLRYHQDGSSTIYYGEASYAVGSSLIRTYGDGRDDRDDERYGITVLASSAREAIATQLSAATNVEGLSKITASTGANEYPFVILEAYADFGPWRGDCGVATETPFDFANAAVGTTVNVWFRDGNTGLPFYFEADEGDADDRFNIYIPGVSNSVPIMSRNSDGTAGAVMKIKADRTIPLRRFSDGWYLLNQYYNANIQTRTNNYIKSGQTAPTTSTEGAVGMLYEDTTNGVLYQCTAVDTTASPATYTWTQVGGGGGGGTLYDATGSNTDGAMTQKATSEMVFADPGTNTQVRIGADAYSTGNRSTAVGSMAQASSWGAVAIGRGARAESADSVVAIGESAFAAHRGSVALGVGAQTTSAGEIQVGTNSTLTGHNNTMYRVVRGVYDGEQAHDVATVGQLQGAIINGGTASPTPETAGTVGTLYAYVINGTGHLAICTGAVTDGTYMWSTLI